MKLSPSALAIFLSAPTCSAFLPTSTSPRIIAPLRPLSMVGGGMIPQEPEPEQREPFDPSKVDLPERRSSNLSLDDTMLGKWFEDEEAVARSMGVSSLDELDPYSPDIYIKPRPGKYGWEPIELTKEYKHKKDETTVQTMSDNEREENYKLYKQLYEDSIMLRKLSDYDGADEARYEFLQREKADPWYDLNIRMEKAVKEMDTEEIEHLKTMIEKVRGPPPSLKEMVNEDGYIPEYKLFRLTLPNERIQSLLDAVAWDLDEDMMEKDNALLGLAQIERKKYEEGTEEQIEKLTKAKAENTMNYYMNVGERDLPYDFEMAEAKQRMDDERKKLMEIWSRLGYDQDPEEYFTDMSRRKEGLKSRLTEFAKENRRLEGLYEDEEEMQFDEEGFPIDENFDKSLGITGYIGYRNKKKTMGYADKARAELAKKEANGRPRMDGDRDVMRGELAEDMEINDSSSATTGPLTVEVSSTYNAENSDPPMRKHCFQYTVRITNNSPTDTVQLLSRRFEIQTVMSEWKDIVQGEGVTGRQPILKPGEVFEYTSTAPLSVRPIGSTIIAARMSGEYRYCTLREGQEKADEEQINKGQGEAGAQLATFHFVFPEDQQVPQYKPSDWEMLGEDDDEDEEEVKTTTVASSPAPSPPPKKAVDVAPVAATPAAPATSLPGEPDMMSGNISITPNDSSDTVTSDVRVVVTSTYRPERSDAKLDKHCFAYNVRISNESKSNQCIQLVSRRFEIQTVGSQTKDVVQGPGVTGRQPVLKPGENFEYTSTAPLSVRPMLDKTQVVARMSGEYNFVQLADDGVTPLSSTPLKAELGAFHFILPEE